MISFKLLVCLVTFWCLSHAQENALIYDWKEKKLVEMSKFHGVAVCENCMTACPAPLDSVEENLINAKAAITENAIFSRKIYPERITAGEMAIDICEKLFSPVLVQDKLFKTYETGYEMFYDDEGSVNLKDNSYDHYIKVAVDGKSSEHKEPPSEGKIIIHRTGYNIKFEVVIEPEKKMERMVVDGEPSAPQKESHSEDVIKIQTADKTSDQPAAGKKLVFHWISVLLIDVMHEYNITEITPTKDTINDYFSLHETTSYCENYFLGDSTPEVDEKSKTQTLDMKNETEDAHLEKLDNKRPAQDAPSDNDAVAKKQKTNTPQQEHIANHPAEDADFDPDTYSLLGKLESSNANADRLVKAPIVPVYMFHTQAARLASCTYLNFAFVRETVAEKLWQEIDLYLYALYRTFPNDINLKFGISRKSHKTERHSFAEYPWPRVIYRDVHIQVDNQMYGAVVVIHNVESVQNEDRICSSKEELAGWDGIKIADDPTVLSYACARAPDTWKQLGFYVYVPSNDGTPTDTKALNLNNFPFYSDTKKLIEHRSVLHDIEDTLDTIKKIDYQKFEVSEENIN